MEKQHQQKAPGEPAEAKHREKILVVDDERDILHSTKMLLNRLGYECVTLPDAKKVVEVAKKEHPDLILQDLRMPDIDLPKLVEGLRGNAETSKIPLVFFSANPELPTIAAQHDASGYLSKPFAEEQINQVLLRTLGRRNVENKAAGKEAIRQGIRIFFHDYWNTLTALNNYAEFLKASPDLAQPEREAATELNRLILELERKTDVLRAQLLNAIG